MANPMSAFRGEASERLPARVSGLNNCGKSTKCPRESTRVEESDQCEHDAKLHPGHEDDSGGRPAVDAEGHYRGKDEQNGSEAPKHRVANPDTAQQVSQPKDAQRDAEKDHCDSNDGAEVFHTLNDRTSDGIGPCSVSDTVLPPGRPGGQARTKAADDPIDDLVAKVAPSGR